MYRVTDASADRLPVGKLNFKEMFAQAAQAEDTKGINYQNVRFIQFFERAGVGRSLLQIQDELDSPEELADTPEPKERE